MKIFIPLLVSVATTIFGVAVPGYQTPEGVFYNYAANRCEQSADYWPMVWDHRYTWGRPGPECAGHPLLLLNEPELREQANMTPAEGAALLDLWSGWNGPTYCCGNGYDADGWQWFLDMVDVYEAQYGQLGLSGIHVHAYAWDGYDVEQLRRWRRLADERGWEIVVTEAGPFPFYRSEQEIADSLPGMLDTVIEELEPTHLFWFALTVHPVLGDWQRMALFDDDGNLTRVGVAWQAYVAE